MERERTAKRAVEHHADGVEVAADGRRTSAELLGGHVHGRPHADLGGRVGAHGPLHGDAEVEQGRDAVGRHEDVGGLEVPVDDAVRVDAVERL